ncbi:MAG: amylo-alpha-1,6-glucosidase, partial [Dehalococcoidia bacterium]
MNRRELEEGARQILLTNLRRGVADWNEKEFSFVVPSLRGYPFQWFWDSCFHSIALTHLDLDQAKAELRTLMSAALPDGFIPHIIFWEMDKQPDFLARNIVGMTSPYYSSTMQPPIIAYAVERVFQATGDTQFRDDALPILINFYRWLRLNRDPDGDSLIAVIQPEEAGTDCSPKYDEALGLEELSNRGFITALKKVYEAYEPLRGHDHALLALDLFHFEDVLVNSIYAFGMRALARLLGDAPEAAEFNAEADRTRDALIAKCWDEDYGAFFDLSGVAENPVKVVTISSLMPLILEDLPRRYVERLVNDWVTNPDHFWLPYPLPSVPASDPKFMPGPPGGFIWRGPTWLNTNWFLSHALRRHGYTEIADTIVAKSHECVEKSGYREYYEP